MVMWTALLIGILGAITVVLASLPLPKEESGFVHARHSEGRTSSRVLRPEITKEVDPTVLPRILTVLTTYDKRSAFVKEYKEVVFDREDGYQPEIFVVSNLEDENPYDVIDFKARSSRTHRACDAIAEAVLRFNGTFDWVALGDDDTAFMYNRAVNFLSHIDHTKPVLIGRANGLNSTGRPEEDPRCFSEEA
eukprot:g20315.t1